MMANLVLTAEVKWASAIIVVLAGAYLLVSGFVLIRERQVGIVVKRFSTRTLEPGRLIALDGEAGYQAETLAPGLHSGYWPWQYRIIKVPVTVVEQGEIALALAADGASIPGERILGKVVDCDNFQDARKFLMNGGEKGRQLGILTAGTLAWARSLGEFGPILIFSGATRFRTEVLPTTVFLELSIGNLETALAVSLLMIAVAAIVLILMRAFGLRDRSAV